MENNSKILLAKCLEIDLLQYVQTVGYVIVKGKTSTGHVVVKNPTTGDSIRIKQKSNPMMYTNNNSNLEKIERGNIINFVINRAGNTLTSNPQPTGKQRFEAYNLLTNIKQDPNFKNDYSTANKKRIIETEQDDLKYKIKDLLPTSYSSINYLTRRNINPKILNIPLFAGCIKESPVVMKNGTVIRNIAFVRRDETNKINGFQVQYFGKKEGFTEPVSLKRVYCLKDTSWTSNIFPSTKQLIYGESALDCLSHFEMYQGPNTTYVSYEGTAAEHRIDAVYKAFNYIKENNNNKVDLISITDNDYNGYTYDLGTAIYLNNKLQKEDLIEQKLNTNSIKYTIHGDFDDEKVRQLKENMTSILKLEQPQHFSLLSSYLNVVKLKDFTIVEIPYNLKFKEKILQPYLYLDPFIKAIHNKNNICFLNHKSKANDWNEELTNYKKKLATNNELKNSPKL